MLFSGSFGSFLTGYAAGFFTREAVEFGKKNFGPLSKKVGEAGHGIVEKSRESFAHIQESFEDLVAEFRADGQGKKQASPKAKPVTKKASKPRTSRVKAARKNAVAAEGHA